MVGSKTTAKQDYRDWHLPLCHDNLTVAEARLHLAEVGATAGEIPLMVQLVENPKYRIPGLDLFHGCVTLSQHDAIHILPGRGLLNKDEAFTIGFTMGSTRKVTSLEEDLFAKIATTLYPDYQFNTDDIAIFRDAVRLAYVSGCQSLDQAYFTAFEACSLAEVRHQFGIDKTLLLAYYCLEKQRYPSCSASKRLLDR